MSIPKVLAAVGLALAASCASANVTYTFTADGVTDSNAQQGTAVFVFSDDGSQLALTLTDNVNPTSFIASELDGFTFSLSQAPTTQSLLSVSAQSVINCTGISGSTCPAGDGSSPYGYGSVLNGDEITLGAGFTGSGFCLSSVRDRQRELQRPGRSRRVQQPPAQSVARRPGDVHVRIDGAYVGA